MIMEKALNTLAEIQRLCNEVPQGTWTFNRLKDPSKKAILSLDDEVCVLENIPHPSKNFEIFTNDIYYHIINENKRTLYRVR